MWLSLRLGPDRFPGRSNAQVWSAMHGVHAGLHVLAACSAVHGVRSAVRKGLLEQWAALQCRSQSEQKDGRVKRAIVR